VPTIVAIVLAGVVTFVLEGLIEPYLGVGLTAALGLAVWFGVFYATRRSLMSLRGD
jgi:hypothetical protein